MSAKWAVRAAYLEGWKCCPAVERMLWDGCAWREKIRGCRPSVCHGKLGSGLASCRRKCHGKVLVRALRVFRDRNFVLLHTPTSPRLLLTTTIAPLEVVSFSPACSQSSNSGNDDIKYQQGTSQDDHPRPGVEDEVSSERDETKCLWGTY